MTVFEFIVILVIALIINTVLVLVSTSKKSSGSSSIGIAATTIPLGGPSAGGLVPYGSLRVPPRGGSGSAALTVPRPPPRPVPPREPKQRDGSGVAPASSVYDMPAGGASSLPQGGASDWADIRPDGTTYQEQRRKIAQEEIKEKGFRIYPSVPAGLFDSAPLAQAPSIPAVNTTKADGSAAAPAASNPPPKPGFGEVWRDVIDDMEERNRFGTKKYGTPLQYANGRNSLRDAYEEALDLAVYLKTHLLSKWVGDAFARPGEQIFVYFSAGKVFEQDERHGIAICNSEPEVIAFVKKFRRETVDASRAASFVIIKGSMLPPVPE